MTAKFKLHFIILINYTDRDIPQKPVKRRESRFSQNLYLWADLNYMGAVTFNTHGGQCKHN